MVSRSSAPWLRVSRVYTVRLDVWRYLDIETSLNIKARKDGLASVKAYTAHRQTMKTLPVVPPQVTNPKRERGLLPSPVVGPHGVCWFSHGVGAHRWLPVDGSV